MEIKPRKEIAVLVEGAKPNYSQLIGMLVTSQQMATDRFGPRAMAVYRLPNRFYDGTPPEA